MLKEMCVYWGGGGGAIGCVTGRGLSTQSGDTTCLTAVGQIKGINLPLQILYKVFI